MKKSIYSLVLNDNVIKLIDDEAKREGQSRSTLVNKVLSKYVGYYSEREKLLNMLDEAGKLIHTTKRIKLTANQKNNSISAVATLNYKYSPKINYTIELSGLDKAEPLSFKASIRSGNEELLKTVDKFFNLFCDFEHKYLNINQYQSVTNGKFERELKIEDEENAPKNISNYIEKLHELLNKYVADFSKSADDNLLEGFLEISNLIKI